MADLSLDDFIRKNNVKVRINNPSLSQGGRKPQQTLTKGMKGKPLGQKPMGMRKTFDARQKLPSKTKAVGDARNKIMNIKKNGGGDARNKIVQKQVQKGTFDVRSLLQRKAQQTGGPKKVPGKTINKGGSVQRTNWPNAGGPKLSRTLNNANTPGKGQVVLTNTGLSVTRPTGGSHVSVSGHSLQVTRQNKPQAPVAPSLKDAIPIIQIRNDRYKQPVPQARPAPPMAHYHEPAYDPYTEDPYLEEPSYARASGYRDLDDPKHNPQSMAVPDLPRMRVSNLNVVERAGMRPVMYSDSYSTHSRAPPGSATLSARQAGPKLVPTKLTGAGVKRRSGPEEVPGPLRLGKGGGPGIDLGFSPVKRAKPAPPPPRVEDEDIELIDLEDDTDYISPLQGFRIVVSNLFNSVTQDDIIELFGAVGPLKKARLMKTGSAEVVYVNKNDALSAVQKYHSRELDGQPMYVKMTTPVGAQVKKIRETDPDITGEALRLYKKASGAEVAAKPPVEVPTIHRALFKAGPPGPNKSVRFTVKI